MKIKAKVYLLGVFIIIALNMILAVSMQGTLLLFIGSTMFGLGVLCFLYFLTELLN